MRKCRWFGGKGRVVERLRIRDSLDLDFTQQSGVSQYSFMIIDVYYNEGLPEAYLIPFKYLSADKTISMAESARSAVISKVTFEKGESGLIFDAVHDPDFCKAMLQLISKKSVIKGDQSEISGNPSPKLEETMKPDQIESSKVRLVGTEQSNSSVVFDDQLILKS